MKSYYKNLIGEVVTDYGSRVMKILKKGLLGRSMFEFYGSVKVDSVNTKELTDIPNTPKDGKGGVIYTKYSDGRLYYKSNEVAEVELSANGGTITTTDAPSEGEVLVYNDSTVVWGHPEKIHLQVRNDEGSIIPAGTPLYSRGEIGGSERIKVGICEANNPAKMPCIGLSEVEMNTTSTKDNFAITQGIYNTNISGFTSLAVGDILYVDISGSALYLTQTKPTGESSLIQNIGIVVKTNGTICQGLQVSAIGRANDMPNLDDKNIFIGDSSNKPVSQSLSSAISGSGNLTVNGDLTVNGLISGKSAETFRQSFNDDLGTTKHWMPWGGTLEQSVNAYQEEVAMAAPCGGRVVSCLVRTNSITGTGNLTIGIETKEPGGLVGQAWDLEETETLAVQSTDDNHAFHFVFSNATHFNPGDLIAMSIQSSVDLSGYTYWYVSTVIEWDWNNLLGTTSGEYDTSQ